ncbi:MAG: flavodoxin domain-containing protein [Chloroflexota bacterium]
MGKWQKEAARFLENNENALAGKQVWLFSSTGNPGRRSIEMMDGWSFDAQMAIARRIQPQGIAVFHGTIDPDTLNFLERFAIKNVKAPTGDFRDWDAIAEWANDVATSLNAMTPLNLTVTVHQDSERNDRVDW